MQCYEFAAPLHSTPEPRLQRIEVSSSFQIPGLIIVGLPGPEVLEARERIRAAIDAAGLEFPRRRVLLNLTPADLRKREVGLELAMALAILSHEHAPDARSATEIARATLVCAWGELGLAGEIKPAGQLLRTLYSAWRQRAEIVILSSGERETAQAYRDLLIRGGCFASPFPVLAFFDRLDAAWRWLAQSGPRDPSPARDPARESEFCEPKIGWAAPAPAPEALELLPLAPSIERIVVAIAAGQHHALLLGPRGSGKSRATEWFTALEPPLPEGVLIERLLLWELNQRDAAEACSPTRHLGVNVTASALLGSMRENWIRPGELVLAHGGRIIADEILEWPRDARECLRQPLEHARVRIVRPRGTQDLPAAFSLLATGNLCPCGGWPNELPQADHDRIARCGCRAGERRAYLARLSGPILDRIDVIVLSDCLSARPIPAEGAEPLSPSSVSASLERMRSEMQSARARQIRVWGAPAARISAARLERWLRAQPTTRNALPAEASLRGRHKLLRVAISLATLDEQDQPDAAHILEASAYRAESTIYRLEAAPK